MVRFAVCLKSLPESTRQLSFKTISSERQNSLKCIHTFCYKSF